MTCNFLNVINTNVTREKVDRVVWDRTECNPLIASMCVFKIVRESGNNYADQIQLCLVFSYYRLNGIVNQQPEWFVIQLYRTITKRVHFFFSPFWFHSSEFNRNCLDDGRQMHFQHYYGFHLVVRPHVFLRLFCKRITSSQLEIQHFFAVFSSSNSDGKSWYDIFPCKTISPFISNGYVYLATFVSFSFVFSLLQFYSAMPFLSNRM